MELIHDPLFWWALLASVYATVSDYIGSQPQIKQNATYQLLLNLVGSVIRGQVQKAGKNRRRGRRG